MDNMQEYTNASPEEEASAPRPAHTSRRKTVAVPAEPVGEPEPVEEDVETVDELDQPIATDTVSEEEPLTEEEAEDVAKADDEAQEETSEQEETQTTRTRSQRTERPRAALGNELGTYFTQNLEDATMPDEERAREMDAIRSALRNKTVLWGTVNRVYSPDPDGNVAIDLLFGQNTWVRFVAEDFFAETPRFAGIAQDKNPDSRGRRWYQAANHYVGAKISFIVIRIDRDEETRQPIIWASRSLAMTRIRDATFFNSRRGVPKVGDYGLANIVDCRPNRIVIEFCGVEVKMNNGELVAFQYLPDATKDPRFQVGKTLYVAIQAIRVDPEKKTVELGLSHAMIELTSTDIPPISKDIIGANQLGTIIAVRNTAYIAVFNGCRCRCLINKNDNRSYEPLNIGDKVLVQVRSIASESMHMVRGACRKI